MIINKPTVPSAPPKRPELGYTSAHTILKNEFLLSNGNPSNFIDTWLHYTKDLDYRVLLDTGSTDGSWEYLVERAKEDPNLIIEQKTWNPWRFDVARTHNLAMVPEWTNWCFSPDMDEFFTINTLDQLAEYSTKDPSMTNMSCARLDVYSYHWHVGQPISIGTNKIFKYGMYSWFGTIFEHLRFIQTPEHPTEREIYNPQIALIHNQDFLKESRPDQYLTMMMEIWKNGSPGGHDDFVWVLYFLFLNRFKAQDFETAWRVACDYIPIAVEQDKKKAVLDWVQMVWAHQPPELTPELRELAIQKLFSPQK